MSSQLNRLVKWACPMVFVTLAFVGCGEVTSTAQLAQGTQETSLHLEIVDGPGDGIVEVHARIRRGRAQVRLERGEQLFVNGVPLIRSTAVFSEALVARVPVAEAYTIEFHDGVQVGELVISNISSFVISDVDVVEYDGHWQIQGKASPAFRRGDTSQRVIVSQTQGEVGRVEVSAIVAQVELFKLGLINSREAGGRNGSLGPGHALLTVSRVTETQGWRLHGFARVSATIRVVRELAVTLPDAIATNEGGTR